MASGTSRTFKRELFLRLKRERKLTYPAGPGKAPSRMGEESRINRSPALAADDRSAEASLQAVILVGGEGTRLRPLTYGTPKPMVPLFGVPFLERTIVRLREAGVDEVILAAGYLPQAIMDHFGDGSKVGLRVTYVLEEAPLGTAGALRNVADRLTGAFFVLNGDVLTSLDLRAMLAFHESKGGEGVIHAIRVDDPSAFGCLVHDASGRISRFVEKPPRAQAPTDEINAGTYLLEPSVLARIPCGRSVSIERETFPDLLAAGGRLYAYTTEDYWLDVGRPEQYVQAHGDVLDGKLILPPAGRTSGGTMFVASTLQVPPNVQPPVFVGEGVEIDPTAIVGPYVVVGDNCRIGAGAHVRNSIVWDGVAIEAGAVVTEAILASNVRVGNGAIVSAGAVIGHDARVPAGQVLDPGARVRADD